MNYPVDELTSEQIEMLDSLIRPRIEAVKAAWTPEQEAMARGVKLRGKEARNTGKILHDGRYHSGISLAVYRDEFGESGEEEPPTVVDV